MVSSCAVIKIKIIWVIEVQVLPKSRVYFKKYGWRIYGVCQRDPDEQTVEALGKEPVACRGKWNTILNKLTKLKTDPLMSLKNSFYYSFYPWNCPVLSLSLSHDTPSYHNWNFCGWYMWLEWSDWDAQIPALCNKFDSSVPRPFLLLRRGMLVRLRIHIHIHVHACMVPYSGLIWRRF